MRDNLDPTTGIENPVKNNQEKLSPIDKHKAKFEEMAKLIESMEELDDVEKQVVFLAKIEEYFEKIEDPVDGIYAMKALQKWQAE